MTNPTTQFDTAILNAGWQKLPAIYRMPQQVPTLQEAQTFCRQLAESHYENFHIATWFLPKKLRPHFQSIYAYCRISDDLGDEVGDTQQSLALLDFWNAELDACYRGEVRHPVFVALAETIRTCNIPKDPFANLLKAFRQDQTIHRYQTMQDVFGYCQNSANPVGHLVLYAAGYRDPELFTLSNFTCTALQLANFWQDVSVDYQKNRIYLPLEDMHRFGVTEEQIRDRRCTTEFRALMQFEVDYAYDLFRKGLPLIQRLDAELAVDIELFSRGGQEILRAIERQNFDVLRARPVISKPRKLGLLLHALAAKLTKRQAA
ncbi:MAG TPA: squalene synthase HpnC [Acidobacteriaceae bacterium]|jgi:squalene synthase HpnC|nr:squalene synthase HpnC [Acidobacteriaceae bacterium]